MDTTTDVINVFLLLTIVRQARGIEVNLVNLLIPVIAVAGSAAWFLRTVPTDGNDLQLIVILGTVGALLGLLGGLAMVFEPGEGGGLIVRAGLPAVLLMSLGSVARMGFVYAVGHGYASQVGQFSRQHMIMGQDAWVASLVLMALAEVVTRVTVTRVRAHRLHRAGTADTSLSAA